METSSSDMIFGAVILVLFIVIAYYAGRILQKFKNKKYAKAWAPLTGMIKGTVVEDNGGGATSYLSGTYKGMNIVSCMVPQRNRYSEGGSRYNYFDISVLNVQGLADWKAEYKEGILGFGKKGWDIESEDKAVEQNLYDAGLVDLIAPFGRVEVRYDKRQQKLLYSEDVTPAWVPEPARYKQELELMLQLVAINESVNTI